MTKVTTMNVYTNYDVNNKRLMYYFMFLSPIIELVIICLIGGSVLEDGEDLMACSSS